MTIKNVYASQTKCVYWGFVYPDKHDGLFNRYRNNNKRKYDAFY